MDKQSFDTLARRALERSCDGRLMWLLFVNFLWGIALLIPPAAAALCGYFAAVRRSAGGPVFWLLLALPAVLVLLVVSGWLISIAGYGTMREILRPAPARVGRAFKSGFSMWLAVFYPLPWALAASSVSNALKPLFDIDIWELLPMWLVPLWGLAALLAAAVSFAVGIPTAFLQCGVAAGGPEVRFVELYNSAFRAFKNGWGRFVLGTLAIFGAAVVYLLAALPGTVCLLIGSVRNSDRLMIAGTALSAAWCVGAIFVVLRLSGFALSYFLYLYLDASGVEPVGIDPAPEPDAPGKDEE